MYVRSVINILLVTLISNVKSNCEKTYINECEKVSDVEHYGQKKWENLMISPNRCKKSDSHTLDEMLKSNAFDKARNLQEIVIVEKVTGIEPGSFDGLKKLRYLKLYKNHIKVLQKEVFANLPTYKVDLQHNGIENMQVDAFKGASVVIINLSHNKLNNIQANVLNIRSLEELIISHNVIQSLAEGCFHENLEILNLAHNSITSISDDVLKPLQKLKELNLSHNRFRGISVPYGLGSVENLDLSHNEISSIVEGSFHGFYELKHLKLNHNYLTSIPHNIFQIGNLIVSLHLHYNAFMYISENTARILGKLEEMTVSGNPWACPCLQIIADYTQEHNITAPECDQHYFSVGKSAICIITNSTCTFDEKLTQDGFQNFQNSVNPDLCGDL